MSRIIRQPKTTSCRAGRTTGRLYPGILARLVCYSIVMAAGSAGATTSAEVEAAEPLQTRLSRSAPVQESMDSQKSMQEEREPLMAGGDDSTAATRPALTPEQTRFFESKIRPVLIANCYSCHSQQSGRSEGGLDVDSAAALINGGESGPALDPDDFTESLLWKAINYDGLQMPPQDPLPPHVIEDFRQWLADGAPDPRVTEVVRGAYRVTPEKIEEARSFW